MLRRIEQLVSACITNRKEPNTIFFSTHTRTNARTSA